MRLGWIAWAALLAGCNSQETGLESRTTDGLLITGAYIVDTETGTVSSPSDVLIIDGVIAEVGEAGTVKDNGVREKVAAEGMYLLPGLINVHAHIGDGGFTTETWEERERDMRQFVRYGVTSIFVPGGTAGNDEELADWKRRCGSEEIVCPRVFGSGDLITAPGSHPINTIMKFPEGAGNAEFHKRGVVALAEDEPAEPLIARKNAARVDAIKIVIEDGPGPWYPRPRLSAEKVREIVEASHERGLKVVAHVSNAGHVVDAVAAGVDAIMHSSDSPIPEETLDEMARRSVFYVATLSLYDGLMERALGRFREEAYAAKGVPANVIASVREGSLGPARSSEEDIAEWKRALADNLVRVRDAGAPLALGTDTNNPSVYPGYAAHEELALMTEAGLTPAEALRAATIGGADFLDREGEIGRAAPGYSADLIALRENPLDDILNTRTLEFVVHRGIFSRDVVSLSKQEQD